MHENTPSFEYKQTTAASLVTANLRLAQGK